MSAQLRGQLMQELQDKIKEMKRDSRGEVKPTSVLGNSVGKTTVSRPRRRGAVLVVVFAMIAVAGVALFFWRTGKNPIKTLQEANWNIKELLPNGQNNANFGLVADSKTHACRVSPLVIFLVSSVVILLIALSVSLLYIYKQDLFNDILARDTIGLVMGRRNLP